MGVYFIHAGRFPNFVANNRIGVLAACTLELAGQKLQPKASIPDG